MSPEALFLSDGHHLGRNARAASSAGEGEGLAATLLCRQLAPNGTPRGEDGRFRGGADVLLGSRALRRWPRGDRPGATGRRFMADNDYTRHLCMMLAGRIHPLFYSLVRAAVQTAGDMRGEPRERTSHRGDRARQEALLAGDLCGARRAWSPREPDWSVRRLTSILECSHRPRAVTGVL